MGLILDACYLVVLPSFFHFSPWLVQYGSRCQRLIYIYIYNYIQLYTYYDYNILWLFILDGKLRMILHQPSISKVCKPITTCHRSPSLLITIWVSRKWTDFFLECLAFQSGQQRSSGSSLVFDVSWCFLNWFEVWVLQRSSSFFCVLLLHQIDQETKLWDLIFDHVCIFLFRFWFYGFNMFFLLCFIVSLCLFVHNVSIIWIFMNFLYTSKGSIYKRTEGLRGPASQDEDVSICSSLPSSFVISHDGWFRNI